MFRCLPAEVGLQQDERGRERHEKLPHRVIGCRRCGEQAGSCPAQPQQQRNHRRRQQPAQRSAFLGHLQRRARSLSVRGPSAGVGVAMKCT